MMRTGLDLASEQMIDPLPEYLRTQYKLLHVYEALEGVHFPRDGEHAKQARRRFVYEELLEFQLRIQALRKANKENEKGISIRYDLEKLKAFIATLPYELPVLKSAWSMKFARIYCYPSA